MSDFQSPHSRVPLSLVAGKAYSPALAIYVQDETKDVTIDASSITITSGSTIISVDYVGKSLDEISQDISAESSAVHCNPLAVAYQMTANELYVSSGELTSDGAFVIRMNSHMVQYTEETRIRALPPYPDSRILPWYPRVDRGNVVFHKDGVRYVFSVPEYDAQSWSVHYGKPFFSVRGVKPYSISGKILKVSRKPILWRDRNIRLKINGVLTSPAIVDDVDENNGLIFLNTTLAEDDSVEVSYTYREDTLVYRRINLNPTVDHNPAIVGMTVVLYLLPALTSLGRTRSATVNHAFGTTITAAINSIPYDGPNPILVIGAYQVRPMGSLEDVGVRDIRTRGGGIDHDRYDDALNANTEAYSATDAGRWDGIPFPGAASGVLRLPRNLLDTYPEDFIQEQVNRHLAVGGNILLDFTDEFEES